REPAHEIERKGAAPFGQRGDDDVFAQGQPIEELVDLVGLGQAELADRGDVPAGDIAPVEKNATGGGAHFTRQHLEEGALAGAIGTDDAAQLALPDREIDVAVGFKAAEGLAETPGFQGGAGIGRLLAAGGTGAEACERRQLGGEIRLWATGGAAPPEECAQIDEAADETA